MITKFELYSDFTPQVLVDFIIHNNYEEVENYVKHHNVDLNERYGDTEPGQMKYNYITNVSTLKMLKLLIELEADPFIENAYSQTLAFFIVDNYNLDRIIEHEGETAKILFYLIDNGLDLTKKYNYYKVDLMTAIKHKSELFYNKIVDEHSKAYNKYLISKETKKFKI